MFLPAVISCSVAMRRIHLSDLMMANTQEQYALKIIDPAQSVDEDAFISPKRPMMIALGAIGGLFLGILLVFIRNVVVQKRKNAT